MQSIQLIEMFFLEECCSKFPQIFPFVLNCYKMSSNLLYNSINILSSWRIQQGDPLGTLLFCLAVHPIVKQLQSDINVWYLDDGTIGGNPTTLLKDLEIIANSGFEIGLQMNLEKCELVTNTVDLDQSALICLLYQVW